tara:strand:+ start:272 stop:508 length:237 start_codon:yes stop_codon:yes gene_type:complete
MVQTSPTKKKIPKNWVSASKSIYFYREKGVIKQAWAHKYARDYGITGRKSFIRYRKTKDPTSKIVYKVHTKKEWAAKK